MLDPALDIGSSPTQSACAIELAFLCRTGVVNDSIPENVIVTAIKLPFRRPETHSEKQGMHVLGPSYLG